MERSLFYQTAPFTSSLHKFHYWPSCNLIIFNTVFIWWILCFITFVRVDFNSWTHLFISILKLDSHLPNQFFLCFNESPLKLVKNAFYFILKALFVLKIFRFLLTFWACIPNSLIRKVRLILKFMTSQPGQQRIATHILLNISRIMDN